MILNILYALPGLVAAVAAFVHSVLVSRKAAVLDRRLSNLEDLTGKPRR